MEWEVCGWGWKQSDNSAQVRNNSGVFVGLVKAFKMSILRWTKPLTKIQTEE